MYICEKPEHSDDPAIPLLSIYPKKMNTLIQNNICTPMFTVVSCTKAKIGNLSAHQQISGLKDVVCTHMYFSHKKE